MKRVIKVLLLCFVMISLTAISIAQSKQETAVSTEGYGSQNMSKAAKPTAEDKKYIKEKVKERKQYFKNKKQIKKYDRKRTDKIQDIEYLEKRLEQKKKQLETYQSNP